MISRRGMPVPRRVIGVITVAFALGAVGFATVAHKGLPLKKYTYVTAAFDELPPNLRKTDDVRVHGQRVGTIREIAYEQGQPRVHLQLPRSFKVYGDANARIRSRSLLGSKYVDIDPGHPSAGPLGDAVIPPERTRSLTELDQVLDTFDPATRAALGSTVRELGSGFAGRGQDLADLLGHAPDLLADLGVATADLSSPEARLVDLLTAAEKVTSRFTGREATLERLSKQATETLSALTAQGALKQSLDRLPATLDAVTPALAELGSAASALAPALSDLRPVGDALGAATPDLRGTLREAPPVLEKLQGIAGPADVAINGLATALQDLRPVAAPARRAIASLAIPLEVLAPYAPEADTLFDRLVEVLGDGDDGGHWAWFTYVPTPDSGAPGPTVVRRNPYPAPGQAPTDGRAGPGRPTRSAR